MAYRPLPILVSVGATVTDINRAPSTLKVVVHNPGGVPAYAQLFDARAADVTLGTTIAQYTLPVLPGESTTDVDDLYFRVAVSVACTTTPTGAVAAACHVSPAVM